jgi:hypothetical protein
VRIRLEWLEKECTTSEDCLSRKVDVYFMRMCTKTEVIYDENAEKLFIQMNSDCKLIICREIYEEIIFRFRRQ